jgi:hypothetical protein
MSSGWIGRPADKSVTVTLFHPDHYTAPDGGEMPKVKQPPIKFDREIPAILTQPILCRWLPGKAPSILLDEPGQVDEEHTNRQLAERLAALSVLLGCEPDEWARDPQKPLMRLASAVFPGFKFILEGKAQHNAMGRLYPTNPVLIRWYQRSVQLRVAGVGLHEAVKQAARDTPAMRGRTDEYVIKHWQKAAKTSLIAWSEHLINKYGLEKGSRFILTFPLHLL